MNLKIIGFKENRNPYKGNTTVILKDFAGKSFEAQILPITAIQTEYLPQDRIYDEITFLKADHRPLAENNNKKPWLPFTALAQINLSWFVIANISQKDAPADLVFGFAGFNKNIKENCLNLQAIYSSSFFENDHKYKVTNFGRNMVAYGAYLSNSIFNNNENGLVLKVPGIEKDSLEFYKKLNFKISGIFQKKGFLTSHGAELIFKNWRP